MPQPYKHNLPKIQWQKDVIGNNISKLRKERALSQQQLAEKIGITQELVSRYERNRLNLSVEMLIRFSIALEVNPNEFLDLELNSLTAEKEAKPSLRITKRLLRLENLPKSKQKAILLTLDSLIRDAENQQTNQ